MSLFARLSQSALVVAMLAAGTGCAQSVGDDVDATNTTDTTNTNNMTDTTSSALTTNAGGPETFILEIVASLVAGGIEKGISGDGVDYERINKIFEEDLEKFANKEHLRSAHVEVIGALKTLESILKSYDPNASVNQSDITVLFGRVDTLNDDLASMRAEDTKKVGLRTYLLAATVQHAIIQTLALIDKDYTAEHEMQLRIVLQDHSDYVGDRVAELEKDTVARLGKVTQCEFHQEPFRTMVEPAYEKFDDLGANQGKDPAIPDAAGADFCEVGWSGMVPWRVEDGGEPHVCDHIVYGVVDRNAMQAHCNKARDSYLAAMHAKLDLLNGFTADTNLPDTRKVLADWQSTLAKHGGPIAK